MTHSQLANTCLLVLTIALAPATALTQSPSSQADQGLPSQKLTAEFARLLNAKCIACHNREKREGAYSMETLSAMARPGDSGVRPVVVGKPADSEILRRLTTTDASERMPSDSPPLTEIQIQLVRKWIESAADVDAASWSQPIARLASPVAKSAPSHYPRTVPITALAIDSSAELVWVSGYAEVVLWQIRTAEHVLRLPLAGTQVARIALSPDGKRLAVSSGQPGEQGFVQLWCQATSNDVPAKTSHWQLQWTESLSDVAADLAFSPNGNRLAIACPDGSLEIADLIEPADPSNTASSKQLEIRHRRLVPHADAILSVNWSDKGDRLVTGSRDRTAKIFDTTKETSNVELIANYDRHERAVGGVTYLEANPVSLDETGKLRLWTGDDNDRTLAEKDNLARFLEPLVHHDDQLWLADQMQLRQFALERKTVDDGQDESGKTKTKKVVRWQEQPVWSADNTGWILSVGVTDALVAVGDDRGQVTVWSRKDRQLLKQFRANP